MSELLQGSSPTHNLSYDVFLSFRGADTRLSFVDHLYKTLIDANIATFLDEEEVETDEDLKPELESAIKASRASIVVMSENYASSTWCLDELVLILQQRRTSNQMVIPIFYYVEPSHVRNQQRSFGDAMAKHKQRMETETNAEKKSRLAHKIETWKKALTEVAYLTGLVATDRYEMELIQEVVTYVHHKLGVPLKNTPPLLVGMEDYIKFIASWLNDGSFHTADILAILGMAGTGKTSLARYVHGLHNFMFNKSSFIEDVNRVYAENGLLYLQKQLCFDISETTPIQFSDVSRYTSMIENALTRQKVFIVLDDIGTLQQLDALLGNKGFHPGSKIIITTRDASLVQRYVLFNSIVQPKHTSLVLQGLHYKASLQLLIDHAFMGKGPEEGYERLAEKVVAYCQGLPLALEVLGKSLHNQDVAEWEDYIERLKKEPNSRIKFSLQMSFDSLSSNNDKELFKHIACFFVGEDREFTETILKKCGIRTVLGIKNLIDRCLLMIGPSNELKMHQLVQEMGRDLVRQESPNKPWKRSRLWCSEESFKVLKQKKGTRNMKGLVLDMKMLEKDKLFELKTNALSKLDNLMLLKLNYVQLNGSYKDFPGGLRWLCMHGFPLKSIPSDLRMENLVALDMSFSALESFDMSYDNPQRPVKRKTLGGSCSKDERPLRSLKILNLSFCKQLRILGGFLKLPALERLILANCTSLIEVCESIEQCDELVLIDLSYCNMLEKFPRTMLKKVTTVLLDGCSLGELPIETRVVDYRKCSRLTNMINSHTFFSSIVVARCSILCMILFWGPLVF